MGKQFHHIGTGIYARNNDDGTYSLTKSANVNKESKLLDSGTAITGREEELEAVLSGETVMGYTAHSGMIEAPDGSHIVSIHRELEDVIGALKPEKKEFTHLGSSVYYHKHSDGTISLTADKEFGDGAAPKRAIRVSLSEFLQLLEDGKLDIFEKIGSSYTKHGEHVFSYNQPKNIVALFFE